MGNLFIYPYAYRRLKRGPQVILPKDIGIILAYSGIDKNSVCVDAGTGSGWLALSLARFCRKVYSYDVRPDFIELAEKNRQIWNLDNVEFKNKDVTKRIDEKDADLVTLDMPSSEKALKNAKAALKENGHVVGYLPNTEQVKKFVMKLTSLKFADIYTVEVIVRDMLVRKEGTRPTNTGLWHTAYLVFARKV
jgi:tRNA (adenine57-N1/adenine58-N1)-methyltransferase catalytic subunit